MSSNSGNTVNDIFIKIKIDNVEKILNIDLIGKQIEINLNSKDNEGVFDGFENAADENDAGFARKKADMNISSGNMSKLDGQSDSFMGTKKIKSTINLLDKKVLANLCDNQIDHIQGEKIRTVSCLHNNCSKRFKEYNQMRKHLAHHLNREIACYYCHKQFLDEVKLARHYLQHGKKLYTCAVSNCGRQFDRKFNLHIHEQRH